MFNKRKINELEEKINVLNSELNSFYNRLDFQEEKLNTYIWAYDRKPKYNAGDSILDENGEKSRIIRIEPTIRCNEYCFVYHVTTEHDGYKVLREHHIKRKVR